MRLKTTGKPTAKEMAELRESAKREHDWYLKRKAEENERLEKSVRQAAQLDSFIIKTIPLHLSVETIGEMSKENLKLLLAGEHPKYKDRRLTPDSIALVSNRLEEIKDKHLNDSLDKIITLGERPHWMNWVLSQRLFFWLRSL